ncbi:MAG: UbiA-like protein EboC, partial [Balneolales bacterium]
LLATFGLYGGGVVINDVFDAELDARERPERPIPSGRTSRTEAGVLGAVLLLGGIISAFQVNVTAGAIALAVMAGALLYDGWAKQYTVWGPLVMGMCRGGNLLLGVSIVPAAVFEFWFLGAVPIVYIAAITLISQGEVHGGTGKTGISSLIMLTLVFAALAGLAFYIPDFNLPAAAVMLVLLASLVLPAFIRAARSPTPGLIKNAVKRGVISLIILNAVIAAGFAGWMTGVIVLLLLPLSLALERLFAVT